VAASSAAAAAAAAAVYLMQKQGGIWPDGCHAYSSQTMGCRCIVGELQKE
jgi:hypothetical protein